MKRKQKLESEYYPIVKKWLLKNFSCFCSEVNFGIDKSRADVIGVKDIGGDLSGEIETIVVEVKRGQEAFATAAGQTLGYKIYANRVYLADKKENRFSEDEIQIASHLGIGLIQIGKGDRCYEVLSSPHYNPITKFNRKVLLKLSIAKCQFCETHFETGDRETHNNLTKNEKLKDAIKNDKGFIFWNRSLNERKEKLRLKSEKRRTGVTWEKRYICPECIQTFFNYSQNN